jgi:hypothetical protein
VTLILSSVEATVMEARHQQNRHRYIGLDNGADFIETFQNRVFFKYFFNTQTQTNCYKSRMTGIFEPVLLSTMSTRQQHTYNRSNSKREPQKSSQ